MKDLTFLNDGNEKYLEGGLVNFGKLRMIAVKLEQILSFQPYSPAFSETIPLSPVMVTYCQNLRSLDDAKLYSYSCLHEKRAIDNSVRLIDKWKTDK